MVAKLCHTFSSKALVMNLILLIKMVQGEDKEDQDNAVNGDYIQSIKDLATELMETIVFLKAKDHLNLYPFAFELRKMDTDNKYSR